MEWLLSKTDDDSLDDPLESDEEHEDESEVRHKYNI